MSFSKPFDWRSSPCLKTSSPRESAYHPQNYLCLFNPIFFGLRGSESPEKNVQNHDPSGPTSGECWSIELTINCRFANDATVKKQQSRVKRQAKGGPETLPPLKWNIDTIKIAVLEMRFSRLTISKTPIPPEDFVHVGMLESAEEWRRAFENHDEMG